MKHTIAAVLLALLASTAHAQTYTFSNLSADDATAIGRGLDKLFGADPLDRAYTDRTRLYERLQAQITQQNQAAAKAQADAAKAAQDKAIADAVAKAVEKAKSEEPQP